MPRANQNRRSSPPPKRNWLLFGGGEMITLANSIVVQKWGQSWPTIGVVAIYLIGGALAVAGLIRLDNFKKAGGELKRHLQTYWISTGAALILLAIAGWSVWSTFASRTAAAPTGSPGPVTDTSTAIVEAIGKTCKSIVVFQKGTFIGNKLGFYSDDPKKCFFFDGTVFDHNGKGIVFGVSSADLQSVKGLDITPDNPTPRPEIQTPKQKPKDNPSGGVTQSGNGNQQTVTQAPVMQSNNGGCNQQVVGGNNNTNNCGPPEREIEAKYVAEIAPVLAANVGEVSITANSNNDKLAQQLFKLFDSAGWKPISIGSIMAGQVLPDGVVVRWRGPAGVPGQTTIAVPNDRPDVRAIVYALGNSGVKKLAAAPDPNMPEHKISFEIGGIPQ